jgi:hypothetical protein
MRCDTERQTSNARRPAVPAPLTGLQRPPETVASAPRPCDTERQTSNARRRNAPAEPGRTGAPNSLHGTAHRSRPFCTPFGTLLPVLPIATISTASGLLVTFAATTTFVATSAAATTPTSRPTAPTTAPGSVITITGGPNATANIPGPRSDAADFYGIVVALVVIVVAIVITRVAFGWRRGSRPASE